MSILDTIDPSCVIGLVLAIVLCLGVLWFLRYDSNGDLVAPQPEPEPPEQPAQPQPQPQTANEPPVMNTWSAIHTGQHIYAPLAAPFPAVNVPLTPDEAERFILLLDAADHDDPPLDTRDPARTHCPLCIIETCDQWGIPLDEAHTIGAPKLCRKHRRFTLAPVR